MPALFDVVVERQNGVPDWAIVAMLVVMFGLLYDPFLAAKLTQIRLRPQLRSRIARMYFELAERRVGLSLFCFGLPVFLAAWQESVWPLIAISFSPFLAALISPVFPFNPFRGEWVDAKLARLDETDRPASRLVDILKSSPCRDAVRHITTSVSVSYLIVISLCVYFRRTSFASAFDGLALIEWLFISAFFNFFILRVNALAWALKTWEDSEPHTTVESL